MVKGAIVEFADIEVEEDIVEVIIGTVVESAMYWYHERIFDLWEKTKIKSNQLYIKKCSREREREREREIRIGLKIPSSSLIVDQIHFSKYSTKHSHPMIQSFTP